MESLGINPESNLHYNPIELCHVLGKVLVQYSQFMQKNQNMQNSDAFFQQQNQELKAIRKQLKELERHPEIQKKQDLLNILLRLHIQLLLFDPFHGQINHLQELKEAFRDTVFIAEKYYDD